MRSVVPAAAVGAPPVTAAAASAAATVRLGSRGGGRPVGRRAVAAVVLRVVGVALLI